MTGEVTITYLTPERFARSPQVGLVITQDYDSFARWATWPMRTERSDKEAKRIAGAFAPAALPDGVVKGSTGPAQLLVADVDGCGADGFDRSVAACADFMGFVVTSCNATDDDTRHRVVLVTDRPMTPDEREIAWRHMERQFKVAGIELDGTCSNQNRLYYAPVWRSGGIFRAAHLTGDPVPVDAMLADAGVFDRREREREEAQRRERAARASRSKASPEHKRARAILCASRAVATASAGMRHKTLCSEAFSLTRFGMGEHEVKDALLDAFVSAAGEDREAEGEKALRDAVRHRRGTSA